MAVVRKTSMAKMILDYGKVRYTVGSLDPNAGNGDVYALYEAVRTLRGGGAADVYFEVDSELAWE